MSTNYKTTGTRVGLDPSISASQIDRIAAFSSINNINLNLVDRSDRDFITGNRLIKNYENINTKKTLQYSEKIEKKSNENYFGSNFASGDIKSDNYDNLLLQSINPFGVPMQNIPYTTDRGTGFYINAKWSGYNYKWDANNVIAGMIHPKMSGINQAAKEDNKLFIYKNFNEIFLHSGHASGDIGIKANSTLIHSQNIPIKHNAIFFMSGLNKNNMLDYEKDATKPKTKILFLRSNNYQDFSYHTLVKSYDPIKEHFSPTTPRAAIFLYTGELPIIYSNRNTPSRNGFGYSAGFQKQLIGKKIINNNLSLNFTGVYPEYGNRNFTVFNTGSKQEYFYVVPDDGITLTSKKAKAESLKHISRHMSNNVNINILPNIDYIHSGENNKLNLHIFNSTINILGVGSPSNVNYKAEIDGEVIGTGIKTRYINLYRITGVHYFNDKTGTFLSQEYKIPVNTNIIYNQTKIISDDYFFSYDSKNVYRPSYKKGTPMVLTPSGILGIGGKSLNLTLYSTGNNLQQPSVKNEIEKRIRRKYGS